MERKEQIKELNRLYNRKMADLVAIYGKPGVGKTKLIDETFNGKIVFKHTGLPPVDKGNRKQLNLQLEHFYNSLIMHGMVANNKPKDWFDAFLLLEKYLNEKNDGCRQVAFLDEISYLDTPKSYFLMGFESFWNNWACCRKNLMVIVCSSDESWIKEKLINNCGGLYDRVTWPMGIS